MDALLDAVRKQAVIIGYVKAQMKELIVTLVNLLLTTVTCGKCGDSNETCKVGTPHGHPEDTDTKYLWTCRNIPHTKGQCGSIEDGSCSEAIPTTPTTTTTTQGDVDAICNTSQCGGCSTGHHGGAITCIGSLCGDPDAFKTYEWKCDGLSGGADDTCTGNFRNCN